ncbi:DUF732 domain-containing protein [Mycobacterium sp. SM1]|uniref:DUF732 domain-containing protein n=1 Tax=Mycobacterium sp. SM1 TaxID=2816243 RepID=UPI001BCB5001|nr:DUF732 domain-containing protein [Mycobacterium sp. SM1]MBS4730070.1 DUF732 domain-containing protein [Mycobacterium sp. SM1]
MSLHDITENNETLSAQALPAHPTEQQPAPLTDALAWSQTETIPDDIPRPQHTLRWIGVVVVFIVMAAATTILGMRFYRQQTHGTPPHVSAQPRAPVTRAIPTPPRAPSPPPAPQPNATITPSPPPSAYPDDIGHAHTPQAAAQPEWLADDQFLTTLRNDGITSTDGPQAEIGAAHYVCGYVAQGKTFDQIVSMFLAANPDASPSDAKQFVDAAEAAYCPQHSWN